MTEAAKRIELWWCPVHGNIDEGDLIEGQDLELANASDPDGWTGTFYCAEDGCDEECSLLPFVLAPRSNPLMAERSRPYDAAQGPTRASSAQYTPQPPPVERSEREQRLDVALRTILVMAENGHDRPKFALDGIASEARAALTDEGPPGDDAAE